MQKRGILFLFLLLFTATSICYGSEYEGFTKLNPDECVPLGKKVVLSKLPKEWHKYAAFTKICKLKENKTSTAKVSIISIWAYDYYETTGKTQDWKRVPRPIIVDKNNNKIGELPIIYPEYNIGPPDIHYGKWKYGMPSEILIDDVYNLSDKSYYYYEPFKWNDNSGHFEIKNLEKKHGKRPGALDPYTYGTVYKGFTKLNPNDCVSLDKNVVVKQLPAEWHKYAEFTDICKLKQKNESTAKVSIVSILIKNYHKTLTAAARRINETFPLPLIIDTEYRHIGELPEQYFNDEPGSVDLYFGKDLLGIPAEIRVDVENPAVSGDYYYAPIIWNNKTRTYELKSKESINGRRSNY